MSHSDDRDNTSQGLLSRWSRRKQRAEASRTTTDSPDAVAGLATVARPSTANDTAPTETAPTETEACEASDEPSHALHSERHGEASAEGGSETTDAEALAQEADESPPVVELPDPDTLLPDADISAYMQAGVDPALRQRALRRIFMGGEHSLRDGLDDYDQDFSQMRPLAAGVAETLRRWTRDVEEGLENLEDDEAACAATSNGSEDQPQGEALEAAPSTDEQGLDSLDETSSDHGPQTHREPAQDKHTDTDAALAHDTHARQGVWDQTDGVTADGHGPTHRSPQPPE
ncbi:DUF3306 domain-containing protein [Cobetia sp. 14N.309.X.WAT.E.A4]|uniref:DUF3306 domain-containing protein n=1 Tax=Cobetia sp. 14N.309.X.WAT.E.A4 TaxID=2998323 RepID=UPI0025AF440B|nr:DUF3306 domain-containing protein [Cobetia sp. 14N.309.X.WAT.E.A4]MDN2655865.1 DUF3306 domain-containing protein [Cobetia sp. 14N.309.X.WAT.E.A4]